jgi:hypothetical protein
MVKQGGNVMDAYTLIDVVSPSGLPMRGIVGIAPDPIMFIAINCVDVKQSKAFYEQLGFVEQEYPYCRPNKGLGQFEPKQPEKSIYMAPSSHCMGVLLLKSKERKITCNPAVQSLNLVYNPTNSGGRDIDEETDDIKTVAFTRGIVDPSGVALQYQSVDEFELEESVTR